MSERLWNPYFVAYAAAHGRAPVAMLEADREDWPGGATAGFQLWMNKRWSEWATLRGYRRTPNGGGDTILTLDDHADFAGWLKGRSFAIAERGEGPRSSRIEHTEACSIDKPEPGPVRRFACRCDCGAEASAP